MANVTDFEVLGVLTRITLDKATHAKMTSLAKERGVRLDDLVNEALAKHYKDREETENPS